MTPRFLEWEDKTYKLKRSVDHFLVVSSLAEDKSLSDFVNLDLCLINNSFEDTGGTWAIVGAILAGSSSDNETNMSIYWVAVINSLFKYLGH